MSYDVFAQYYDELMQNVEYGEIAEKVDEYLREYRPESKLLCDLACGTGTLAAMLSEKGYDVIGIDASPDMLMTAREKCPASVLLLCQSMDELDLYGTIDAAVCTLDSINHVTDKETVGTIFKKVSLFLENNGIFVFDVNTPYKHENILSDSSYIIETDNVFCAWQNSYENGLVNITLDFFEEEDGVYYRSSECFSERAYTDGEIREMLSEAELEVIAVKDGYTDNEPCETTQRLVYITKRKTRK